VNVNITGLSEEGRTTIHPYPILACDTDAKAQQFDQPPITNIATIASISFGG
jgi:hypothetical protein